MSLISYNKFNPTEHFSANALEDNERVVSQKITYPRCKNNLFYLQTPYIKTDYGGIPSDSSPYHPTVLSKCNSVKIPLEANPNIDNENKEDFEKRKKKVDKFRIKMQELDAHMISKAMKIKLFGSVSKACRYEYIPIVKTPIIPEPDSDDDETKVDDKVKWRPKYMKSKIPVKWGSEDELQLEVYGDSSDKNFEKIEVNKLEDLRKYMCYRRSIRYTLHGCKIWADKQAVNGAKKKKYGIVFKIKKIIYDKNELMNSKSSDIDDPVIAVDSDEEEEEEVVKNHMGKSDDEDSEDESEESYEDKNIKSKKI